MLRRLGAPSFCRAMQAFQRGSTKAPMSLSLATMFLNNTARSQTAFFSTKSTESDDDDADDEQEDATFARGELSKLSIKNYDVDTIKRKEEKGTLLLKPFYQRGYKWSQLQASMWIESILRGFPCLPQVTLLQTRSEKGKIQYSTFDGQQRLTSIMKFIRNQRGDHWPKTKKQKKKNLHDCFALEKLTMNKDFEGLTFKDLPPKVQNRILDYDIQCAIIPDSWAMADYIEFFQRIQGGGTPMSDHELRRAISRGPFTELLDELADHQIVQRAFSGCSPKQDDIQDLLVRYFALIGKSDVSQFGKPTKGQEALETMKKLNKEMGELKSSELTSKREEMMKPLLAALDFGTNVFRKNEPFRRAFPLQKKEAIRVPNCVWKDTDKLNAAIFVCQVYCFSREAIRRKHSDLLEMRDEVRSRILTLMQTHSSFTDTLRLEATGKRIHALEECLLGCIEKLDRPQSAPLSQQTRKDLIANARNANLDCPLCKQPLSQFDDHLHIDHIVARAKGGSNDPSNLQVVHKTCNLRKSDK